MKKSQLALLTDDERVMVLNTTPEALAKLDEDAVANLHRRVRKARNKYTGVYRRRAAKKVTRKYAPYTAKNAPAHARAMAPMSRCGVLPEPDAGGRRRRSS